MATKFTLPEKNSGKLTAKLFGMLYGGDQSAGTAYLQEQMLRNKLGKDAYDKMDPATLEKYIADNEKDLTDSLGAYTDALTESPLSRKAKLADGGTVDALSTNLGALGAQVKAHPFKAGLGGIATGANVAGLFDDDHLLGQALGLGGGAFLGNALGMTPMNTYLAATSAGALGSLFDKLRTKRDAEREAAMQAQRYSR